MKKNLLFILLVSSLNYAFARLPYNDTIVKSTNNIQEQPTTKSKLYPNPAVNYVIIKNFSTTKIKNISILSMVGSTMLSKEILDSNENQEINVSKLQTGRYFVKVSYTDGNQEILNMIKI